MTYLLGALAGLVWGGLWALLNCAISKRAIEKNSEKAVMTANALRMVIDVAALGSVFLARKLLPFSPELMLVGTAAALSMITIIFAFRVAGGKNK